MSGRDGADATAPGTARTDFETLCEPCDAPVTYRSRLWLDLHDPYPTDMDWWGRLSNGLQPRPYAVDLVARTFR
jgi:hypothetical protein